MKLPSVTVVLPVRNAEATLREQLDALLGEDFDGWWEVLVVDNGSTDKTKWIAAAYADRSEHIRVIDARRSPGVAVARNEGLAAAKGDLVLCCDADDEITSGWIAAMARALGSYDLVEGRIAEGKLNEARHTKGREPHSGLQRKAGFLYTARGANMGVRRAVAESIGGWDENFVGGDDDVDFAWRVQLAGYSIGFAAEAVIEYRLRKGVRPIWKQFYRYGKNRPQLYRKFAAHGMPRRTASQTLKTYTWCVVNSYNLLLGHARRERWVRICADTAGRLVGSIRLRVWCP